MPAGEIRSLTQLKELFSDEPRLRDYAVVTAEEGLLEVRVGAVGVVFADVRVFSDPTRLEPHLTRSNAGSTRLLLVGTDEEFDSVETIRDKAQLSLVVLPISRPRLMVTLRNNLDVVEMRARATEKGRWAERYRYELGELIAISRAISSERDVVKLLGLILEKCRYVTGADAGSVYIVDGEAKGPTPATLRFVCSQNDSVAIDTREFTLPVDGKSIVGAAVISRSNINIPDLYELDQPDKNPWHVRHNRALDEKTGYQTRSMLTVPMVNQRDEVIGVIQLINKRRDTTAKLLAPNDFIEQVIPFDRRSEELAATLASQAGISLENAILYEDIRRLFEGFVQASVTAIESRDPTTSGHSQRVATLTCGLAQTVDRLENGPYAEVHFTNDDIKQIEYAGLLHDFGKVGVREKVLVKSKKLYEHDRALLLARFDFIQKSLHAEHLQRKLERALAVGAERAAAELREDDERLAKEQAGLADIISFILKSNEPTVLAEGSFERLADIAAHTYLDPAGARQPYLTDLEIEALKVPRGSLTVAERVEIESHVVHTHHFLAAIPWGRKMRNIPSIAGAHHEKLDGTGYPHGLRAEQIPLESKMMAIADIFDALTASDRPYKRAVPVPKALDILADEVKRNKCDADLFKYFVDAKVWTKVIPG